MSKEKRRHPEFGARFELACDGNPLVPPQNYGRLSWIVKQFKDRFDTDVTIESVRKWSIGVTYPRPDAMMKLAAILAVDQAWLALGTTSEISEKDAKIRKAEMSGAVNLLAGIIQMSGCHPAFPDNADDRAREESTDLYAIIRGAQYRLHVALGQKEGAGVTFSVPVSAVDNNIVIGVVQEEGFCFRFFEINHDTLAEGKRKDGAVIVRVDDATQMPFREIKSFAERL